MIKRTSLVTSKDLYSDFKKVCDGKNTSVNMAIKKLMAWVVEKETSVKHDISIKIKEGNKINFTLNEKNLDKIKRMEKVKNDRTMRNIEIIDLWSSDVSYRKIAYRVGCSINTVYRVIKNYGSNKH